MTTAPDTIHVDVVLNLPLEGGGVFPVTQGVGAIPTQTDGLVVFPALTGPFEMDDSRWSVTHVGTGRRIPVTFAGQEQATGFADAAGALTDWSQDRPTIPGLEVIRLAQEHGGTPDQHVLDAIARYEAKHGQKEN